MATQNKTDIGLIGLAVMGENLALNMESRGWSVSVYNRTVPGVEEGVVERFMNGRAKDKHIEGFTDIKDFVNSIAVPRKIMMMVRAGSPVDELMEQLFPYLSPGDILIDGGNSNYEDTNRRVKLAESKGFLFVGAGVSGGEEGALNGASIMPGGSEKAWVLTLFCTVILHFHSGEPSFDNQGLWSQQPQIDHQQSFAYYG